MEKGITNRQHTSRYTGPIVPDGFVVPDGCTVPDGVSARKAARSSSTKAASASELWKERLRDNCCTSDLGPAWSRETAESRLRSSEGCR